MTAMTGWSIEQQRGVLLALVGLRDNIDGLLRILGPMVEGPTDAEGATQGAGDEAPRRPPVFGGGSRRADDEPRCLGDTT